MQSFVKHRQLPLIPVMLLLWLSAAVCQAQTAGQNAPLSQPANTDEAQVRRVILRFFDISNTQVSPTNISPQAVNDHMALWSSRSPSIEARRQSIRTLMGMKQAQSLSVDHLVISSLLIEDDRASANVAYDFCVVLYGDPSRHLQRLVRHIALVKEESAWKVWQYSMPVNDLAAQLWTARSASDRAEILARTDKELLDNQLTRMLLLRASDDLASRPEQEAVRGYEVILEIAQRIHDLIGQAEALQQIGQIYMDHFHYREALPVCLRRLDVARASRSKDAAGLALLDLGNIYKELKDYPRAARAYDEALPLFARPPLHRRGLGGIWIQKGSLLHVQKNDKGALACLNSALAVDDPVSNISAWQMQGQICQAQGEYERALKLYERALRVPDSIPGVELMHATLYNDIATIYFLQGSYDKASANYKESLNRQVALHDTQGIADALLNLGNVSKVLGDFNSALNYYDRCTKLDFPWATAAAQNNTGAVLEAQGRYKESIERYKKYLDYCNAEKDGPRAAAVLNNMGAVFHVQGLDDDALDCFRECIARGKKPEVAFGSAGIGNVYDTRKQYPQAAVWYGKALKLFHEMGDAPSEAVLHGYFAMLYIHMESNRSKPDYGQATRYAQLCLDESMRMGDQEGRDCAKLYLAEIAFAQRGFQRARQLFQEVAASATQRGMPKMIVASTWGIGRTYETEGYYKDAVAPLQTAAERLDFMRDNIFGNELNKEVYLASDSRSHIYESLALCQAKSGDLSGALATIERSKSRQVTDTLRMDGLSSNDPALRALIARAGDLEQKLGALRKDLEREMRKSPDRRNRIRIHNLDRYVTGTLDAYQAANNRIVKANSDDARQLPQISDSLEHIQMDLPEKAAVVEYLPLETAMITFVVTRAYVHVTYVPIGRARITGLVDAFYRELAQAQRQPPSHWDWKAPEAQPLRRILTDMYDWLIAPVSKDVAEAEPLLVVPSGTLYRLPFEALAHELPDGSLRFLAQDQCIATLPRLLLWDRIMQARPARASAISKVAIFADPDGTLPGSRKEAVRISGQFSGSLLFLGDQATSEHIQSLPPSVDCVVISTHATIRPEDVDASYLSLARGEHLTVGRIYGLKPRYPAWMTVLSACDSATGGNSPGTEGASLAEAFVTAGSRTVVASHWEISDEVTGQLMATFFGRLRSEPLLGVARAKQYAQAKLLASPSTAHPYYWAGFALMGDWR